MWVVESRAPEPRRENRPARNQTDFKRQARRLPARPRRPANSSTWLPRGPRSALHADREPIYMSFVSKAILWDRGLCHYTAHTRLNHRPSPCPRFLSHMKACPDDLRPPRYLSTKFRPQPPSQGQTRRTQALTETQILEDSRNKVQNKSLIQERSPPVVVPCIPVPPTPTAGSRINPTPPHHNTPDLQSGRQQTTPNHVPVSSPPSYPQCSQEEKNDVQEREDGPLLGLGSTSTPEPDVEQQVEPSEPPVSPVSRVSLGSLSDFSRPSSSRFSRSTDLASGRNSAPSADMREMDSEGSTCRSQLQPSPAVLSALDSCSHQSSEPVSLLYQPLPTQAKPLTSDPPLDTHRLSNPRPSCCKHMETTEDLHQDATVDPGLELSLDPDHGLAAPASPSATWSSCPSPQWTTPRSGSAAKLTPSPSAGQQEWTSHRWPVLPPISPVRGVSGTAASHFSQLSCSHSHVFDELEAIAPHSSCCSSPDLPLDSTGCPSPDTELTPGLAALTVGCDSGNLSSLSRVQLLLLGRPEPETRLSPSVLDWPGHGMQYDSEWISEGVSSPPAAASTSEPCDSAGKVQGDWEPEHSEGGSGSPSSWIIDPSPSHVMFGSTDSPCKSNHSSSSDEGGPTKEESNYPEWWQQGRSSAGGRRHGRLECKFKKEESRMEERKTKVLDMLSKLQDSSPRQPSSSKGRSNFEDFDFLAKYCIFSREKLAEYKRAFEAVDSDGDGYISCLQVLLALKNIIPPELLSDEEEIYVYRILEMVDFRVTDGLTDLRLFAVIASLAQKIAVMDDFMRSLIGSMDFRSLEVKLFKAKQLFLFLLEEQAGGAAAQQGFISAEQLLVELRAGGIHLEQEEAIKLQLQHIPSLDLLDFLAYLPLFMLIHKSVIANPLDDHSNM